MPFLLFLLVASVIAYRVVPRETLAQAPALLRGYAMLARDYGRSECEPFRDALAARGRRPIATVVMIGISLFAYAFVPFSSWASVGLRTTNGEWWRLVTAIFVHGSLVALAIDVAAMAQIGHVLERLVGRFGLVTAFVASGVLAGLMTISGHPLQLSSSASSAVAGLYGLMAVAVVAGYVRRSAVTVPIAALQRMAPVAVLFAVSVLVGRSGSLASDLVGFAVGIGVGLFAAHDVRETQASTRHVAMACGAAAIVAIAAAVPLRGILDVKPELQKIVALEHSTTASYETAAARMRAGKTTADAVASVITTTIVPALRAADEHLAALSRVPDEDKPSIADARRYLRLRIDAWTLRSLSLREPSGAPEPVRVADGDSAAAFRARAQARHRSTALSRGRADAAERQALEAFARIAPAS